MRTSEKLWKSRKVVKSQVDLRKVHLLVIITFTIIILVSAKMFLFSVKSNTVQDNEAGNIAGIAKNGIDPQKYITHLSITKKIAGLTQKINVVEVKLNGAPVKITPELSYGKIFGYELLSDMAKRKSAYAAVNAGFFYLNGYPSGMVVKDGQLITPSTGKYPVFIICEGKASIKLIQTQMWLNSNKDKIKVTQYNPVKIGSGINVYTPSYGYTNKVQGETVTATVVNGKVTNVITCEGERAIPENGYLVVMKLGNKDKASDFPLKEGEHVSFTYSPEYKNDVQAYECGSWLVQNSRVVAPKKDPWVGLLTNYDPRTAVGIKSDNSVLFVTVDGRQEDYSFGVTAEQLAQLLLSLGATDAAMLDGGASTEMIFDGKIINKPSFNGKERLLGGGILVEINRYE